jgi:hypothetical protein
MKIKLRLNATQGKEALTALGGLFFFLFFLKKTLSDSRRESYFKTVNLISTSRSAGLA